MKKLIAYILIIFIADESISQPITTKIGAYQFPKETEGVKFISIEMQFGKPDALAITGDTADLKNAGSILIDLVCTDFPSSSNLIQLNKKRIEEFYRIFPFVNPNQVSKIEILRQKDGTEKEKAQQMFHGLIIKFRLRQTKEIMIHDLTKIVEIIEKSTISSENKSDSLIDKKLTDSLAAVKKNIPVRKFESIKDTIENSTFSLVIPGKRSKHKLNLTGGNIIAGANRKWLNELGHDSTCYLTITPGEALRRRIITRKDYKGAGRTGKGIREIGWKANDSITILICSSHRIDSVTEKEGDRYSLKLDSASIAEHSLNSENYSLPDSTIFKIFGRNKWINIDVVGDVTGSMYPYTAQLLLWLKLQSLDSLTRNYCFFNDGDNLPDHKKKMGKTGGVYSKECSSFSEVLNLVKTTMENGGGGDAPENNIEALIEAEKKFPDVAFHVLIADNWAPIKDISLIEHVTKPVRIVLCGVYYNAVNIDYLNLARLTGGSVHLIESDLINLSAMHEGEILNIGDKIFKILDGRFKDVSGLLNKNNSL